MIESVITISLAGLFAGFIFSMPIAGPVSILITSNALKGRLRFCNLVSIGASFADFSYVFVAVFGLTRLYSLYKPAMPYIFSVGAIFFLFLGYRIIRTKIDIEHLEDKSHLTEKIKKKEKGAFYTGLMINFLNPTLFIGVLTSSFFVISLIASLGLNTGGLAGKMEQNVKEINSIEGQKTENAQALSIKKFDNIHLGKKKEHLQDPVDQDRRLAEEEVAEHVWRDQDVIEHQQRKRQHGRGPEDVPEIRQRGEAPLGVVEMEKVIDDAGID